MPAVNDVGEPGAREPHARFDGRELETERLVRVTEVGQPDGKPRASRLLDLPPKPRHRASSRPYTCSGGPRGEHSHLDDVEIHRPGGGVTALEVWGTPICGPTGTVDYTIAAFTDVSDRKAADRALADQASLLDLAHDAILVRDAGQVITFWNRGAERTYGFTRGPSVGSRPRCCAPNTRPGTRTPNSPGPGHGRASWCRPAGTGSGSCWPAGGRPGWPA